MKKNFLIGLSISLTFCLQAQDSIAIKQVFAVFEAKHAYERALYEYKHGVIADTASKRKAYAAVVLSMKKPEIKQMVLALLNKVSVNEDPYKSYGCVYMYEDVLLSSSPYPNNTFKLLNAIKVLNYCIYEKNEEYLLPIEQILFLKREK